MIGLFDYTTEEKEVFEKVYEVLYNLYDYMNTDNYKWLQTGFDNEFQCDDHDIKSIRYYILFIIKS